MAATVFSILMVGLSMHLRGGMLAWRRTTTVVEELQRVHVALERLAQDVANAMVFDQWPDAVPQALFANDALQFYTVQRTPTGSSAGGQVWFVTYALEETAQGRWLIRAAQTVRQARAELPATPDQLFGIVEQLAFRYGVVLEEEEEPQITWLETWDDPTQLPKLVEVTMDLGTTPSLPRYLRQVFIIPSGSLTPVEEGS